MFRIFLDSADRDAVAPLLATGLFAGVTTNPSILDKSGLGSDDLPAYVAWALDHGAESVFAQVWGETPAEMIDRAHRLRRLSDRVVVKVPYGPDGIIAARALASGGRVLVTALHDARQILPVIASGAAYAAPFVARMDENGTAGVAEVARMHAAISATGSDLQLLVGSLRTPDQLLELAHVGIRNVTIAPAIWSEFFTDRATAATIERFHQLASRETGDRDEHIL